MSSLKIRGFQMSLEQYINSSDIPWEVKRMVIADILRTVEYKTSQQLKIELAEHEKKEAEENAEDI